jgi:hypothetical protein
VSRSCEDDEKSYRGESRREKRNTVLRNMVKEIDANSRNANP